MLLEKKKTLVFAAGSAFLILGICFTLPALSTPILNTLKQPLNLLAFMRREASALIFYHCNYAQNEKLNREISLLKSQLNALREIHLENTRLKNLLSLKEKSPHKLVAARVIGRSTDNWSSSIIIDKGRRSGIKPGMPAITYLGLAGRVIEATESTSKILLLSDPALSISALVQRSRQEGLVSGTLGPNLIMKYLPEEADIKAQDIIVTSGLTVSYPKGLLIGRVVDTGREFSGLSRYAIIKPALNLSNIEEVLIIIS